MLSGVELSLSDRLRRRALRRPQAIGAELTGDAVVQRVQSSFIRAPDLIVVSSTNPPGAPARSTPGARAWCIAIDGRERWLVHNYLKPAETDFDSVDRDACIRTILGVGADFTYDIISGKTGTGRRRIASKFRDAAPSSPAMRRISGCLTPDTA